MAKPEQCMRHDYSVKIVKANGDSYRYDHVSRDRAAYWLRWSKVFEHPAEITHRAVYFEIEDDGGLCFGCLARPALWDHDCDGPYQTASCGQCDWWTALEMRERSEAAGRRR